MTLTQKDVRQIVFYPPDSVVGALKFYRNFIFYLSIFFFVSYPPSFLNGTQPKPAICSEVSAI